MESRTQARLLSETLNRGSLTPSPSRNGNMSLSVLALTDRLRLFSSCEGWRGSGTLPGRAAQVGELGDRRVLVFGVSSPARPGTLPSSSREADAPCPPLAYFNHFLLTRPIPLIFLFSNRIQVHVILQSALVTFSLSLDTRPPRPTPHA